MERLTLPCAPDCPFNRLCADKYLDGACVEKIDKFALKEVGDKQSEKWIANGEISFRAIVPPDARVYISNGVIQIVPDY